MPRRETRALGALSLSLVALAHCGGPERPPADDYDAARPDAGRVIRPVDVYTPPVPDASVLGECGGTRTSLVRSRAEIILVVDRSGSMAQADATGTSKWTSLRNAMRAVLPTVQGNVAMGLVAYPRLQTQTDPNDISAACGVRPNLDVEPAFNNAAAVLAVLNTTSPSGATPTADALAVGAAYFDGTPDPVGHRYLVLATDGAPNCNGTLSSATCRCSGADISCRDPSNTAASYNCLDDTRLVARMSALAARGIDTFVIGLPGTESYADVLTAMAVAGGQPRTSAPRYYTAANATQLTLALGVITSGIADCRFALDAAPPDPDEVDVRLGAQRLGRDRRHVNGWDWSEGSGYTEIMFYGVTCDVVRSASGGATLVAAFGCPPAPAPG